MCCTRVCYVSKWLPGTKCPPRGVFELGNMWTVLAFPMIWTPFWSIHEMHVAVLVSTMALAPFSCSRTYFSKCAPASLKVPSNCGFIWENRALPALNEGLIEKADTPDVFRWGDQTLVESVEDKSRAFPTMLRHAAHLRRRKQGRWGRSFLLMLNVETIWVTGDIYDNFSQREETKITQPAKLQQRRTHT